MSTRSNAVDVSMHLIAESRGVALLQEPVRSKEEFVGFNLRGTKHIPFKQSEEFAKLPCENVKRHLWLAH